MSRSTGEVGYISDMRDSQTVPEIGSRALEILRTVFGYQAFRGQQQDIITHIASGHDALVLMPTGGGKSLCYQIPAMIRHGVGVVVSPLIALMQDQVDALETAGVRAAYLNSTQSYEEVQRVEKAVLENALDLLYIAPERLVTPRCLNWLKKADIPVHLQIVLCPGYNDAEELEKTFKDFEKFKSIIQSIAVVPVGLTKFHRNNLPLVTKEIAIHTIETIENFNKKIKKPLAQASDEFFIKAVAARKITADRFVRTIVTGCFSVHFINGLEKGLRINRIQFFERCNS